MGLNTQGYLYNKPYIITFYSSIINHQLRPYPLGGRGSLSFCLGWYITHPARYFFYTKKHQRALRALD